MPVQVQMNDNAAQLQTETTRAARSASLSIELERQRPASRPAPDAQASDPFFAQTPMPASELTSPSCGRQADLDFDEKRKIMCDLLSRAQRPVVTCHAAGRAPGANGRSCIGRLPHPKRPVRKQCEQQVSACCSQTISGSPATGMRICSSDTSSSAPSAYRLSTVGRVSPVSLS